MIQLYKLDDVEKEYLGTFGDEADLISFIYSYLKEKNIYFDVRTLTIEEEYATLKYSDKITFIIEAPKLMLKDWAEFGI